MKKKRVLLFGGSENDTRSIAELIHAMRPHVFITKCLRRPIILSSDAEHAKRRKVASQVRNLVLAEQVRARVDVVVVHRDCDAVEPAHVIECERIADDCKMDDVSLVPVAPAYEIEAWWFMWPAAVQATNGRWRML